MRKFEPYISPLKILEDVNQFNYSASFFLLKKKMKILFIKRLHQLPKQCQELKGWSSNQTEP